MSEVCKKYIFCFYHSFLMAAAAIGGCGGGFTSFNQQPFDMDDSASSYQLVPWPKENKERSSVLHWKNVIVFYGGPFMWYAACYTTSHRIAA